MEFSVKSRIQAGLTIGVMLIIMFGIMILVSSTSEDSILFTEDDVCLIRMHDSISNVIGHLNELKVMIDKHSSFESSTIYITLLEDKIMKVKEVANQLSNSFYQLYGDSDSGENLRDNYYGYLRIIEVQMDIMSAYLKHNDMDQVNEVYNYLLNETDRLASPILNEYKSFMQTDVKTF